MPSNLKLADHFFSINRLFDCVIPVKNFKKITLPVEIVKMWRNMLVLPRFVRENLSSPQMFIILEIFFHITDITTTKNPS